MIRFYSPSPDPSPGPPTPPPSYLIAFFNVSYQSLNSWVLLSNVFLHQQSHFHLTHLSVPHARSVWDSHLPFAPSTHRLHRFHLQNASPLFSPTRPVAASSRPPSASSGPLQWPPSDIPASSCVTPHLWLFLTHLGYKCFMPRRKGRVNHLTSIYKESRNCKSLHPELNRR